MQVSKKNGLDTLMFVQEELQAYCPGIDQHNIIDRETGSPAGQGPKDRLIE